MIALELPVQIEQQVIQTAQTQNISINEYIMTNLVHNMGLPDYLSDTDKELFISMGIMPFKTTNPVTNEMVNQIREEYGI